MTSRTLKPIDRKQTKVFIQLVAANIYHVQPLGNGPLKPAVIRASNAQEALTIYKREAMA